MMSLRLLLVLLSSCLLCDTVTSQCAVAQMCVTDQQCNQNEILVPYSRIFGCCPICQNSAGIPPPSGCNSPSSCLQGGVYAPVQCKGDLFTGRCFCSDAAGNRIFGQMWRNEASEMTCACSRRRAELEAAGRNDVTLHCTPSGDYEPLQCDSGMCWCAQPRSGQPTVAPVPEQDMKLLPCYSTTVIGEQYLRRCESLVQGLANIHREQTEHGTVFFGNPITFCSYDGSYGPFQIINGIAYCTDRDGEILGSWQEITSEMAGMNCNCARDTTIYFPARGMTVTEVCQSNGNYRRNQNVGNNFYCVDGDGYMTHVLTGPDDTCPAISN